MILPSLLSHLLIVTHCHPFTSFPSPLSLGTWYHTYQTTETASLPLHYPITTFINSLVKQMFMLIDTEVRARGTTVHKSDTLPAPMKFLLLQRMLTNQFYDILVLKDYRTAVSNHKASLGDLEELFWFKQKIH